MNKTRFLQILALVILAALALFFIKRNPQSQRIEATDFQSCQEAGGIVADGEPVTCTTLDGQSFAEQDIAESDVIVDQPVYDDLVSSPMIVKGRARGSWYFEANLPVVLKDQNGNVLAQKGLQAQSDWMTTDHVDFQDTLTFPTPATQYGVLIIQRDNPSGDPQFDASFAVPVRFW